MSCPEIVMQTVVFRFYYVATVTGIQDDGRELLLREFRGFMTRPLRRNKDMNELPLMLGYDRMVFMRQLLG